MVKKETITLKWTKGTKSTLSTNLTIIIQDDEKVLRFRGVVPNIKFDSVYKSIKKAISEHPDYINFTADGKVGSNV